MGFDDIMIGASLVVFFLVAFWMMGVFTAYLVLSLPSSPLILYPLVIAFFLVLGGFLFTFGKMIYDLVGWERDLKKVVKRKRT